jgi:chaperone required for assembly of F1-ATPase
MLAPCCGTCSDETRTVKRFWDHATVEPLENGHAVLLDGRPMRLPGGSALLIEPVRLAHAIAEEWQRAGGGKGGEMSFADTPLTRLAGTAQERIAPDPAPTIDAIARYGETDLLCYRAETPLELVQRQRRLWQPWLDWAALVHDAPLRVTTGVGYVRQHHDSIAALRRVVARQDIYVIAGLGIAVPALGSLVLGLAMAERRVAAETATGLGALDELFQAEQWGEDAEAVTRRKAVAGEVALAARFIMLTRDR